MSENSYTSSEIGDNQIMMTKEITCRETTNVKVFGCSRIETQKPEEHANIN